MLTNAKNTIITNAQTILNTNPNNQRDTLNTSTATNIDIAIDTTVLKFLIYISFKIKPKKYQPNKVNYSAVKSIYFKIKKLF